MELMTIKELANYIGKSEKTIKNWRWKRIGPKPLKGDNRLYAKHMVDKWLISGN